jgi:hypothetical protein
MSTKSGEPARETKNVARGALHARGKDIVDDSGNVVVVELSLSSRVRAGTFDVGVRVSRGLD